jgi:hypothetical protein
MAQNIIDNDTQQIIKKYTVIYKAIFQYSIYFIPLILGIIWAWTLQSSTIIARTPISKETKFPTYAVENGIYRAARISDDVWPILNGFGNVKILGWELQATGNIIIWRNNLISLWWTKAWIILPNRPYIINMNFTWWLDYFTNKNYDTKQLKRIMDNWILSIAPTGNEGLTGSSVDAMFFRTKEKNNQAPTNMEQVLKILQERMFFEQLQKWGETSESTHTSIIEKDKFIIENKLTCLFGFKIIDIFCNINVNRLIKSLPELTLDNVWYDLLSISRKITKKDQVDAFCSNLMINVLRKPYPTAELDQIMAWTCKAYDNRYEKLKVFLWVQNEIESIISENVIGTDMDFNLFKLVSVQQKIYSQHKDKVLDITVVTSYLRYLSNLINDKSIKIPQFYIEESYYFNNIYLKNMLRRLTVETVNPTVNDEVSKQMDIISSINKWNQAIGMVWLDALIINSSLKSVINAATENLTISIQNFEQVFSDTINTFPELKPTALQTDENWRTARFIGVIKGSSNKDEVDVDPIPVVIDFAYQDWRFNITAIRTPQNEWTDAILQWYMKKNNNTASLWTLIYLIQSNTDFSNPDLWMCNILVGIPLWNGIITKCTKDIAILNFDSIINPESITFTIEKNVITRWIWSNTKRQELINSLINNQNINQDRVPVLIKTIEQVIVEENWKEKQESDWKIDPEQISIIDKFKKFVWVNPSLVVKNGDKWLVSFEIKDLELAWIVDIKNNYKLSPLVVKAGWKNITISSFSLSLINLQQKRISEFVSDPLLFIKNIDTGKYNQIMKLIEGWEAIPQ